MTRVTTKSLAAFAFAVVAVLLTACSDSDPDAGSTDSTSTPASSSSTGSTTPSADGLLPAGRFRMIANGRPDAPQVDIEIPEGFSTIDRWVVFDEDPEGGGGISYWTVSEVVRDPCSALGDDNAIDAGSTVVDLIRSLRRQQLTRRTAPEPVSIDGSEGHSLEVHVPAGTDFGECPAYNVWESDPAGARHMGGPGEFDKLWVLDVEGTVVVLTVTVPTDAAAPETAVERLTPVLESAQFVAPE